MAATRPLRGTSRGKTSRAISGKSTGCTSGCKAASSTASWCLASAKASAFTASRRTASWCRARRDNSISLQRFADRTASSGDDSRGPSG